MPTLLINYVYYSPAGHVAEALKLARGFQAANPGLEVHVALPQRSPWELATAVDWLAGVHPIDTPAFIGASQSVAEALLAPLPRSWDYLVTNDWILDDTAGQQTIRGEESELVSYQHASASYFVATRGSAIADYRPAEWLHLLPGLAYSVDAQVRLSVPEKAREWVRARFPHDGPSACVLLGGSGGPAHYPAARTPFFRVLPGQSGVPVWGPDRDRVLGTASACAVHAPRATRKEDPDDRGGRAAAPPAGVHVPGCARPISQRCRGRRPRSQPAAARADVLSPTIGSESCATRSPVSGPPRLLGLITGPNAATVVSPDCEQ